MPKEGRQKGRNWNIEAMTPILLKGNPQPGCLEDNGKDQEQGSLGFKCLLPVIAQVT
jgi:hypothetical protein